MYGVDGFNQQLPVKLVVFFFFFLSFSPHLHWIIKLLQVVGIYKHIMVISGTVALDR